MTLPDGQEPDATNGAGAKPDGVESPAPDREAPTDAGLKTEQSIGELSDAATVPSQDAAAAEAPQVPKPVEQKVAEDAPPVQTGASPADQATTPPAAAAALAKPAAERPARPAKEAEPKVAPRVAPPPGSINETVASAAAVTLTAAYMVPEMKGECVTIEVARDDIPAVMTAARDDERLDLKYLRCLSGVDWQDEGLEVVYHLWSFTKKHSLQVKTRVTYDDPTVPSIATIYPAADWHERETRDMFGINFPGHWNLVPLLLPEDMTDHFPLRKDNPLQEIEEWQGVNLRDGAGEGDEE